MSQIQDIHKRDIYLIECVKKQICLYEIKRCSAQKRNDAWNNVVASMIEAGYYSSLPDKDPVQFNKDVEKIKKEVITRWKSIRTGFVRAHRKNAPYKFNKYMEFLVGHFSHNNIGESSQISNLDDLDREEERSLSKTLDCGNLLQDVPSAIESQLINDQNFPLQKELDGDIITSKNDCVNDDKNHGTLRKIDLKNFPTTSAVADAVENADYMDKYFFRKNVVNLSLARNWRLKSLERKESATVLKVSLSVNEINKRENTPNEEPAKIETELDKALAEFIAKQNNKFGNQMFKPRLTSSIRFDKTMLIPRNVDLNEEEMTTINKNKLNNSTLDANLNKKICLMNKVDTSLPTDNNIGIIKLESINKKKGCSIITKNKKLKTQGTLDFMKKKLSNSEKHRQPCYIKTVQHPPINNYARKQKECWHASEERFIQVMYAFKNYTTTANSYFNERKGASKSTNLRNTPVTENNELKVLLNDLTKKFGQTQIADEYEQDLITTFRKISVNNKRNVFTLLMETMNSNISSQDNNQGH